jgi:hypothetical protein
MIAREIESGAKRTRKKRRRMRKDVSRRTESDEGANLSKIQ